MLNRKFIRRLTPWLTLYLLVASVGLPLQRVYCACIGEASLMLTGGEHECAAHHAKTSEHSHQRMACCTMTSACQMEDVEDRSCGHTDVIVAQFDVDFMAELSTDYFVGLPVGIMPIGPAFHPQASRTVAKIRPIRGPDPPDHPPGRQLLVAHQTFLI